jgi:O-antigen/teichoic acid export membrane protein
MSERIVKNVGSGLLAQAWTALLGLIALPILIRGLGAERYGLLALSLALIGFAAVADLGVGRAASKFIAEDFERNEVVRTQKFVGTALTVSATMGVLGTAVLLLTTPLLVKHVFTIREPMQAQATLAFVLTAVGLMPVLLRILFDGVLAGHHRIAFLSAGTMIANTLKIGLSVAAIVSGYSVLAIVAVNVLVCYLHAGGLWWYTRRHFAGQIRIGFGWDREIARQLLALGVVSTVSWVFANVIFLYADRFLIGIFFPLSLIGYYTMAFDITSKQWYISGSVSQVFFPVFSGKAVASPRDLEHSYLQATKALAVMATGVTMLLVALGRELVTYWISPEFAANSTPLLGLLAVGILLSCYVTIPYTAIIAGGARPGVGVKIFGAATVIHFGASLWWLHLWGTAGIALAFAVAYGFVFVASIWWVSRNLVKVTIPSLLWRCFVPPWMSAAFIGTVCWFGLRPSIHSLFSLVLACVFSYLAYLGLCVMTAYSSEDRQHGWQIGRSLLGIASAKGLTAMADER